MTRNSIIPPTRLAPMEQIDALLSELGFARRSIDTDSDQDMVYASADGKRRFAVAWVEDDEGVYMLLESGVIAQIWDALQIKRREDGGSEAIRALTPSQMLKLLRQMRNTARANNVDPKHVAVALSLYTSHWRFALDPQKTFAELLHVVTVTQFGHDLLHALLLRRMPITQILTYAGLHRSLVWELLA